MMPTFWFKPKRYGYGATPVTWQGWVITAASAIAIIVAAFLLLGHEASLAAWGAFWVITAAITAAVCVISWRKTDGEWRWRWGDR
jgi:hypothetical protein